VAAFDPNRSDTQDLQRRIAMVHRRSATMLMSIDGRGGSGKSTLARRLAALSPDATVVHFDDFYRPSAERRQKREIGVREIGGDFDWQRVRDEVLEPLAADRTARYRRYDWERDQLAEWHDIEPGGIVIVEGNYSARPELYDLYDLTVWVEAPHAVRLRRGIERDGEEARERWLKEWMPEEDRYISAFRPAARADVIVDGAG